MSEQALEAPSQSRDGYWIFNLHLQTVVVVAAGSLFQLATHMQPLFSRSMMVPALSNLLPLFIWVSLVNSPTVFPTRNAVLEQLFSTICKLLVLYWIVKKYSHNEEGVISAFLLLTHSGLLNPELYVEDLSYSVQLRYFEDCLVLNLFTRFMKQRKLQMHDSKNAMSSQYYDSSSHGYTHKDISWWQG
jgi:hypothetical protein